MSEQSDGFTYIKVRRWLEEINQYILHGEGEIREVSGKISLVWMDEDENTQRFLALKPAGEDKILINGRRVPATEADVKKGLLSLLQKNVTSH
ncbi:MAG: hypothetical protein IH586_13980 [Anaerolineaceae bacterium]|nr:hypothetical protein [Anaerolineaceae bacterium]